MGRIADAQRFMREVQIEAKKVVWPERTETIKATMMVVVMVLVIAAFLWIVDSGLSWMVRQVI
ncbi:MAG: preprotein translocase subunit SecE [Mariprofundaceae bacterium]